MRSETVKCHLVEEKSLKIVKHHHLVSNQGKDHLNLHLVKTSKICPAPDLHCVDPIELLIP